MAARTEKRIHRYYNEDQIEDALQKLAICGNAAEVARQTGITSETLNQWRNKLHAERYAEIRAEVVPRVRARLAEANEDLALSIVEKQAALIEQLDPKRVEQKFLARSIQSMAWAGSMHVKDATLLRGMPTEIRENRSGPEIVEGLAKRYPGLFVDPRADAESTAVEVPELEASS